MPKRHGRMFLRGKPGLFVLTSIVAIGIFLAWYTLGGSSVKAAKFNMYRNSQRSHNFQNFEIPKSNKGFSDTVFRKNMQSNQLPKPVQPPSDWAVRRNFGGMKNNEVERERMKNNEVERERNDEFDIEEQTDTEQTSVPDTQPDENYKPLFQKMKRLVHLDLKGSYPKMEYLEKILPLIKQLGATGILLEYEDMFPYFGELSLLAAENAYSPKDIVRLLALCKKLKLEVIPLIQTFGHMEFVLKHSKYRDLRERDDIPQVITPMQKKSYALINMMLQQILSSHPEVDYLHLGSDEVFGLGEGQTHELVLKGQKVEEIFLEHVVKVVKIARSIRTSIITIMWDDKIRWVNADTIEKSGLDVLVEPMVWNYNPDLSDKFPDDIWSKYDKLFSSVWVASAFKGATGSAQFYTNVSHHLQNHLSWVDIIKKMKNYMPMKHFQGMVLTGWQRYDHFGTLCELLPEALPSLAICLGTISNGGFNEDVHRSASKLLNCSGLIELEMPALNEDGSAKVSQDCSFPGSEFYYGTQQLWGLLNQYKRLQPLVQGWLTDYHIKHRFGNTGLLKSLATKLQKIIASLTELSDPMSRSLNTMFDNYTVTEWIEVNLKQRINRLKEKFSKAKLLLEQKTWPRRPLHDVHAAPEGVDLGKQLGTGSNTARVVQGSPFFDRKQQDDRMRNQVATGGPGQGSVAGNNGYHPTIGRGGNEKYNQIPMQGGNKNYQNVGNQASVQSGSKNYQNVANQGSVQSGIRNYQNVANQGSVQSGIRNYQNVGNQGSVLGGNKNVQSFGNQGSVQSENKNYQNAGNQESVRGGINKFPSVDTEGLVRNKNEKYLSVGNRVRYQAKFPSVGDEELHRGEKEKSPYIVNQERDEKFASVGKPQIPAGSLGKYSFDNKQDLPGSEERQERLKADEKNEDPSPKADNRLLQYN